MGSGFLWLKGLLGEEHAGEDMETSVPELAKVVCCLFWPRVLSWLSRGWRWLLLMGKVRVV